MSFSFDDFESAEEAEDAFYDALRAGDYQAMSRIWAEDDDIVVCVHPNGPRLTGLPAVLSSWEQILGGGGLEVQAIQQHCIVGAAMAVHNVVEAVTISGNHDTQTVYCYATNVYIKDTMGWRMVMHHAAAASEEEPSEQSTPSGEVLH